LLKVLCLSILKISPYIIPDISAANKSFKKWENGDKTLQIVWPWIILAK
jgi:hypothetical protein